MTNNPWKYCKIDPEAIKNNPYLRPETENPNAGNDIPPNPPPASNPNPDVGVGLARGFLTLIKSCAQAAMASPSSSTQHYISDVMLNENRMEALLALLLTKR